MRPARTRAASWGPRPASLAADVAPAAQALLADARRHADELMAAAARDGAAALASARAEAARILDEASSEGASAADQEVAAQLTAARHEARAIVLRARRDAYAAVRARALATLVARANTDEGRRLASHLEARVRARVGPTAEVRPGERGALDVTATSGGRRARVGAEELVDQALDDLATDVTGLWA